MAGAKRLVFRGSARADVLAAIDWYMDEGGEALAERFVVALNAAYIHVARHPATGSSRWADALGLGNLRHGSLKQFPYLVFYTEDTERIHIVRVLHGARDIPASLAEPDTEDGREQ